ncbi:hypothetical protein DPMN_109305 [Dreissena polymorpha]|uniref:Reverse transcriptase domain-containing protein n=1 Tax=Dreissena polymorpha TaxID=45954 RepID=A0A9D4QLT9_DREPO|nr:hypothetical protein DPMN_109305 [Dreissena polymorpha]
MKQLSTKRCRLNYILLGVLNSVYRQLRCRVKLSKGLTEYFGCNIGTKQGCVSSSVLVALFINLVTHLKQHCGSEIFLSNQADDIQALFAADIAVAAETASKLQIQINRILEFFHGYAA